MAYAQIVTQYATYLLAKLDWHAQCREWICDKEGNLDWAYFTERYPGGGDMVYVLRASQEFLDLLAHAIKLMRFIVSGLALDQRVHVEGTNACVAHPLVPLVTDTFTMYNTATKLLQRGYDLWYEAQDSQLDVLEDERVPRFDREHAALKALYDECQGIRYVTSLVSIPELPEQPPRFRKPAKPQPVRDERAEWEAQQEALRRQQEEDERRRRELEEQMMRQRALMEQQRAAAEAEALRLMQEAQRRAQAESDRAMLQHLTDRIGQERALAAQQLAAADAMEERWRQQAGALGDENKQLQELLRQLLEENEQLREKIRKEREGQAAFVRQVLERHANQCRQGLQQAVRRHEDPQAPVGTASGADVARLAQQCLEASEGMAAANGTVPLMQHLVRVLPSTEELLDAVKATAGISPAARQVADLLGQQVSCHVQQQPWSQGAALRSALEQLRREGLALQEREERDRLSAEEQRRAAEQARQWAAQLRQRIEQALHGLDGVGAGGDAAVRAAVDAVRAIGSCSLGVVGEQLEQVPKYRKDLQWLEELRRLGEAVAMAVEQLVGSAARVAASPGEQQAWENLVRSSEAVGDATLRYVEHARRGKTHAGLDAAYKRVAAAIKLLVSSARQYLEHQQQQRDMNTFQEDRSEILEKRAEVIRLRAQVTRKKTSTDNLLAMLAGGGK